MNFPYPVHWPQYFTATINQWKHLLKEDSYKDIIINSLHHLTSTNATRLTAFVIMSNHIHLIWQALQGFTPSDIQSSFMRFTANKLKQKLTTEDPIQLEQYKVNKYDRTYQIWKREPLGIELFTPPAFQQKLNYIHENPVRAGLCKFAEDYRYSSARFYETGVDEFGILSNCNGN